MTQGVRNGAAFVRLTRHGEAQRAMAVRDLLAAAFPRAIRAELAPSGRLLVRSPVLRVTPLADGSELVDFVGIASLDDIAPPRIGEDVTAWFFARFVEPESWRVIHDFPNYAVSNHGRVMRLTSRTNAKAGGILAQCWRSGYLAVDLCRPGEGRDGRRTMAGHVLVCSAFHGPRPDGMVANHRDGDRCFNGARNLEWLTQRENIYDGWERGTNRCRGEGHGNATLTDAQALEIRRLAARGEMTNRAIATQFDSTESVVGRITSRKSWRHLLPVETVLPGA